MTAAQFHHPPPALTACAPHGQSAQHWVPSRPPCCKRLQMLSSRTFPARHVCRSSPQDEQPDLIERMVGKLFGQKALDDPEPFGLKRLSEDDAPEMYPATTTEFADPVEGDSEEVAVFRPLLARTRLQRAPLRQAYSADKHGWSPQAFHKQVDTYGAAVVLARTVGGAVFGGYNPKGWIGLGEDRDAIAAFLFTWPDGNTSSRAHKLPKVGGASLAVVDKPDSGPQFGADNLKIPLQGSGGSERLASSRLGSYYQRLPGGGRSLFAPDENAKGAALMDLRVYVAEGDPEKWELDGIIWSRS